MNRIVPARIKTATISPAGFCPPDLQKRRLFYAPLQRNLAFGGVGVSTFTRATTATYIDQDTGLIATAASGVPRFEANGYLSEGQRTNRLWPSDDPEDVQWTNTNVTVAANQTGVGGAANAAYRLTAAAGNATLINDTGVVASAAFNGSLYIKRVTGTGDIDLTLDNGATWTTITVTSGFTLLSTQQTLANPDFGIRIVTSGDAVDVQAMQVEAGTFPTSRIPTTTTAVTRNRDQLDWQGQIGNINSPTGTVYAEFQPLVTPATTENFVNISDNSSTDEFNIVAQNNDKAAVTVDTTGGGGATYASGSTTAYAASSQHTFALAWAASDYEAYLDGASFNANTPANVPVGLARIDVGHRRGGTTFHGHVRNVMIFDTRLSSFDVARIK